MSPSLTPKRSLVVKTVKGRQVLNLRGPVFVYEPDKTLAISPNVKIVLNITMLHYNKDIFNRELGRINVLSCYFMINCYSYLYILYQECLSNQSL